MKQGIAIKNTGDLRQMLIQTIGEVRSGKMDTKVARTISTLAGSVMASAKLDLAYLEFARAGGKVVEQEKPLELVS